VKQSHPVTMVSVVLQGMTNFIWFCRQLDETFPTNADGSLYNSTSSVPYTDAQLDAGVLTTPSLGGCFRQGPGLIGITGQGTLSFSARNMRANDVYVFRVIVVKGDRTDTAETHINIVPGLPPAVDIGYVHVTGHNTLFSSSSYRFSLLGLNSDDKIK